MAAYSGARQLLLWVKTISPVGALTGAQVECAILALATEMQWEIVDDEHIGKMLK